MLAGSIRQRNACPNIGREKTTANLNRKPEDLRRKFHFLSKSHKNLPDICGDLSQPSAQLAKGFHPLIKSQIYSPIKRPISICATTLESSLPNNLTDNLPSNRKGNPIKLKDGNCEPLFGYSGI